MVLAPYKLGVLMEQGSYLCSVVSIVTTELTQLVYKTKERADLLLVCWGLHIYKLLYSARVWANLWRITTRRVKCNLVA